MKDQHECPDCGSVDLDDGSFDFTGFDGKISTHTPEPLHYTCMGCNWDGSEPNTSGDYCAGLEDKADGEHEERMLAKWEDKQ